VPSFDDYIVFVDESGDHGLASIDPNYPVFVLAFCIFHKQTYARQSAPAVLEFKFKHFGHDQVVLHEHEIRKNKGAFVFLRDAAVRGPFMADLDTLVSGADFTLVASAIHKVEHLARYAEPRNPYHVAMGFGLERVFLELQGRGCAGGKTHILFERRGPKEDAEVELEFRRICSANATRHVLPFEPILSHKTCNSSGLQLADLVARPIGRKILNPAQPNRAYDIIQTKFRRSPAGVVKGWGLKVFP
jgi:hypothetical protein